MSCASIHPQLSAYLDGELDVESSCRLMRHLDACQLCRSRLEQLHAVGDRVRALPALPPPPELGLRLRVAASHFSVRSQQAEYWRMRLQALVRAMAVPAVSGTVVALCLFLSLFGSVSSGYSAIISAPDVPIAISTPARMYRAPGWDVGAPIVVEATVSATGLIDDYRVLSGPNDGQVLSRLNSELLFTVFHPATVSGRPTSSHVVLSYNSVRVRG
jgi:anti-sigma factor RsiW